MQYQANRLEEAFLRAEKVIDSFLSKPGHKPPFVIHSALLVEQQDREFRQLIFDEIARRYGESGDGGWTVTITPIGKGGDFNLKFS